MNNRLILLKEKFGKDQAIYFYLLEQKANIEHGRTTVQKIFTEIRSVFGELVI